MHGPWLNTLQNEGVHGFLANTLQGSCENGMGLIWRRRASAWPAIATAASTVKPTIMRPNITQARRKHPINHPQMRCVCMAIKAFAETSNLSLHILDAGERDPIGAFPRVAE